MRRLPIALLALTTVAAPLTACGGGGTDLDPAAAASETAAIRLVDAATAAAVLADAPDDLVVLDVRTPEEFAEGHVDGAVMLDFYEPDFATRLGELDPDVPYVVICRSGNRSSQAVAMMADLGFVDVTDVDGGMLAWTSGGHRVVAP
jgi:phage shock protein E